MSEKITFDYRKLRGRIVEKYETITNFCNAVGFDRSSFTAKLKSGAGLKQATIITIAEALEIEDGEYSEYFFTPLVEKTEP